MTLKSHQEINRNWTFLGIDGFNWRNATTAINIGPSVRITGQDIDVQTQAKAEKFADPQQEISYQTRAVVMGDVNGDGRPDLVAGNYRPDVDAWQAGKEYKVGDLIHPSSNSQYTLRCSIAGTSGSSEPAWNTTVDATTADGGAVWTFITRQSNRLYLNNGLGSFGAGTDIDIAGYKTTALAMRDVNGDGQTELIVGTDGQGIRLYTYTGGKFVAGAPLATFTHKVTALALADVDKNGRLDLIAGTEDHGLWLYLHNGTSFGAGTQFETGAFKTTSLAVGNIDGDAGGYPDLVMGNNGQPNRLYFNMNGAFGAGTSITSDAHDTMAVAVGDVNGDGKPDIVAGNNGDSNRLYVNAGGGSFPSGSDIDIAYSTTAVALTDVDQDGDIDLVVGNKQQPSRLYVNTGAGFGAASTIAGEYRTTALALGNVDGDTDGRLDLVLGIDRQPSRLYRLDRLVQTTKPTDWSNAGEADANYFFITGFASTPDSLRRNGTPLTYVTTKSALNASNEWWYDAAQKRVYLYNSPAADTVEVVGVGYRFGADVDVNQNLVAAVNLKEPANVSSDKAVAVVSEAQASIIVGAGAQLSAAGNIALTAKGTSRADVKTVRSGWGITYANSAPTATIIVHNGVAIDTAGSFTMDAQANNTVNVLTYVPSLGESWNVSVSLGIGHSTSLSEIRSGASVEAATASVLAKNTNSFEHGRRRRVRHRAEQGFRIRADLRVQLQPIVRHRDGQRDRRNDRRSDGRRPFDQHGRLDPLVRVGQQHADRGQRSGQRQAQRLRLRQCQGLLAGHTLPELVPAADCRPGNELP